MEMFCADLASHLKKKKKMLLAHRTWQGSKFRHVLQPGASVKPWGQLELNMSLGCIYIATWLCSHSVWILVSQTSGPLPQVCSSCLTAAPEGEREAALNARSSAGSHGMQGPSNISATWGRALHHTRNHIRTHQTDTKQSHNFSGYFHIRKAPGVEAPQGWMAQRGICSNCADQSDMEENSFMALNLKSGLTQSVQAKPCNLADPSVTSGLLAISGLESTSLPSMQALSLSMNVSNIFGYIWKIL